MQRSVTEPLPRPQSHVYIVIKHINWWMDTKAKLTAGVLNTIGLLGRGILSEFMKRWVYKRSLEIIIKPFVAFY